MSSAAARKDDPIQHTSLAGDLLKMGGSLVVGMAIGVALTAVAAAGVALAVGTGGLAAPAELAIMVAVSAVMEGSGLNELIDKGVSSAVDALVPPVIKGTIKSGSSDVYVNGRMAARAASPGDLDTVACSDHSGPQMIAQGSDSVYINGQPAARVKDKTTCGGAIAEGSANVFTGGGTKTVRDIKDERPWWVNALGFAIGVGLMLCGRGKPNLSALKGALPCLMVNIGASFLGGMIGHEIRTLLGHPVNVITGGKILDGEVDTDFELPGPLPIVWRRFYSSHDGRTDGLFGQGWSVPYSVELRIARNAAGVIESLTYTDEQGREIVFPPVAAGHSHYSVPEGMYLICTDGGHYIVETVDGLYRDFGTARAGAGEPHDGELHDGESRETLKLLRLEDRNSNWLALHYEAIEGAQRLARLTDSCGRVLRLDYADGLAQRVAAVRLARGVEGEPEEVLIRYDYTEQGQLANVTDRTGHLVRHFTYENGLMTGQTLPGGLKCFYAWQGEGATARVVRHWTDDGESYVFEANVEERSTVVTDQLGRMTRWEWNADRQPTAYTDAEGHVWRLEWNELRQLVRAIDPTGAQTQFEYDELGRQIARTNALGQTERTDWNAFFDVPVAEIDAANHRRVYRYDERGNVTVAIDPGGFRTQYYYDEPGLVHTICDARGGYKRLEWNRRAQLSAYTDCSGKTTRFAYDGRGVLTRVTDALGQETVYTSDALGRIMEIIAADGSRQGFRYDVAGRLIEIVDANARSTRYERNARGLLVSRADAAGRVVRFGYDAAHRLATLTNENRETYRFKYNGIDRLIEEIGLDCVSKAYEYDARGLGIRTTDAASTRAALTTAYTRDAVGRVTAKEAGDLLCAYTYGKTGLLAKAEQFTRYGAQPALQNRVVFTYGPRGEVLTESSATGHLEHRYDELSNRIATELPDGRTINWLYYGSGHLHQINLDGMVVTDIERDDLHREVLRTQGRLSSRFGYDVLGRRTRHEALGGMQAAGEPEAFTLAKAWQYDPSGELIGKRHSLHGRTDYRYDTTGRIESMSGTGMTSEVFRWDAAANLVSGEHRGGYVEYNRLRMYEDKRFEYDVYGRLSKKLSGPFKQQAFEYDTAHRLTRVTTLQGNGQGTIAFEYDALGRRIRKSNGYQSTEFLWDGMRLLQERYGADEVTYLYEPDSYVPLARIDTRPAEAANDARREATEEAQQGNVYYFQNDVSGLPEELTDTQGRIVWQARYRVWGNALQEEWTLPKPEEPVAEWGKLLPAPKPMGPMPPPQNLRFQGQYLDRETGLHYNTFRFYDPDIGRFITHDPIGLWGGENLYQYSPNPLTWIDPWGWACIKNKEDGMAREARAKDVLERRYGKENVISERYLRDASGKSVKDPLTGERRRIDFVVKGQDGVWRPVEITSQTAPKFDQLSKELRIREMGGTFARDPNTGNLVPVDGISRLIRVR
ncbi:RHS repeat-associated core domain-containing protein [Trinickia fusca]|uniref:Type IV secretion protein Rhs n=1 Tax=Trinickia fusca TaxID=2419777 RepID=A0A494X6Q0_9BURK|nr:RHS repeat-associated core domain-containing protein [Trinickia fusca]RKP46385.1 type IV secretion protein Rhs [Trinickia fusca]